MNERQEETQPLVVPPSAGSPVEERKATEKKTKPIGESLTKWLHKKTATIKRTDETGYRRRWRKWLTNWLFYDGRQYGEFDRLDGEFLDSIPTAKSKFYIDNHFSWLIDSSQKEWARSKTKLLARPMRESDENAGKARIATDILAHEQKRLRTAFEHQAEGLQAAMCGVYARYTAFSIHSGNTKAEVPIFEKQQTSVEGYERCLDCELALGEQEQGDYGYSNAGLGESVSLTSDGMPNQFQTSPLEADAETQLAEDQSVLSPMDSELGQMPVCPACGGSNIEIAEPIEMEFDAVTGYEEVNAGEVVSFNIDPFELRVHPRARNGRVKTTPYVYWERRLSFGELESAFPWINKDKVKGKSNETNRRFIHELERSGGAQTDSDYNYQSGGAEEDDEESANVCQVWLDRVEYDQCVLNQAVILDNGQVIPPNVPLGQIFPSGVCYIMAGKQLLAIWDEDKNKHLVFGVYRILPTSFWGRGVEDAVNDQKLLNDIYNLFIQWLQYCSSPIFIANASSGLDNSDFSGQPGEIAWVEGWDMGQPIANAITQINPAAMPGTIIQFIEDRKRSIQAKIGSFSTSSGAPDIDVSTATGIKLLREASVALIAMALALKAQVDAEWGEQILKLVQENWIYPHPVQAENDHGAVETKWFTSADIEADLQVSYIEGSVTPRSEIEKRNDLLEALNPAGIPLGPWNADIPRDVAKLLAETFGLPFNATKYQDSERVAKIRCDALVEAIEGFAAAAEQAGIPTEVDPLTGQIPAVQFVLEQVPIEPLMDDHDIQMDFIKRWFRTDAGIYAPELVKATMRARFQEHFQAKVSQAQMETMGMMQAQAPQMMAQAAMASQNTPVNKANGKSPSKTPQEPKGKDLEDPYA